MTDFPFCDCGEQRNYYTDTQQSTTVEECVFNARFNGGIVVVVVVVDTAITRRTRTRSNCEASEFLSYHTVYEHCNSQIIQSHACAVSSSIIIVTRFNYL